jgi:UPF0042 nucleotide-binding protein
MFGGFSMQRMVIITGLSGAGKSLALHCLEDMGFYCIDNLPPALIPKFAELCAHSANRINKVALVVDIRGGEFFDDFFEILDRLSNEQLKFEILFLEANNETLVRRFKESRRRHPLSSHGEVLAGIQEERSRLRDLRGRANKVIDTTNVPTQRLKEMVTGLFAGDEAALGLQITVMSFGFKYGIPLDSDLVFDVRFLPNPYYLESLRNLTGNDGPVRDYVLSFDLTGEFVSKFFDLIKFLLPLYLKEGKTSLTIAIGCTGGKHRSVTLVNHLGAFLSENNNRSIVYHRDIEK